MLLYSIFVATHLFVEVFSILWPLIQNCSVFPCCSRCLCIYGHIPKQIFTVLFLLHLLLLISQREMLLQLGLLNKLSIDLGLHSSLVVSAEDQVIVAKHDMERWGEKSGFVVYNSSVIEGTRDSA